MLSDKEKKELIRNIKISKPEDMQYTVIISTDKDRKKFIDRVEKIVRTSSEYKDYIQFLKEHIGLDSCIFFQNVTNNNGKRGRISIEMHHEPFTLFDIVKTVINKCEEEGIPYNDLLIADEVLELHYTNKVGLVPLSKTAHQVIHNSTKLLVPLNMCYGEYNEFIEEYGDYMDEDLFKKLEKKIDMTKNLTQESFEAIKKEFTYLDVESFEDVDKMELESNSAKAG